MFERFVNVFKFLRYMESNKIKTKYQPTYYFILQKVTVIKFNKTTITITICHLLEKK